MDCQSTINYFNKKAADYDHLTKVNGWYSPQVMFTLMFDSLKRRKKLLDIGIGTGLSAAPFSDMGIKVYGIDGSKEMLNICKKKDIAEELTLMNICDTPFPFRASSFSYIVSNGVFHFFDDLDPLFKEAKRLLKKGGVFGFNIEKMRTEANKRDSLAKQDHSADWQKEVYHSTQKYGENIIYTHSEKYIEKLVKKYDFTIEKQLLFAAYPSSADPKKYVYFKAYILRNN